jgi:SP family arabinose:H+ symporter-like MFS transporter
VTQFFPVLLETAGPALTFWFFGGMSALGCLFVWFQVPETKGRTLEEIEQSWRTATRHP